MSRARLVWILAGALWVGGCATPPTGSYVSDDVYDSESSSPQPLGMIESPPIEPVEPPLAEPVPLPPPSTALAPAPARAATPAPGSAALPAPATATPNPAVADAPPARVALAVPPGPPGPSTEPAEPTEDQLMLALLADLQRYGGLNADELRRELSSADAALTRNRNDLNRIRLAVLYTLARTTPQDDQRALQLFDNVARSQPVAPAVKQLAAVLRVQVAERQRAVKEEQKKAEEATRKLDALRAMERSLLLDRVRSGGGGGGGGAGGGSSGH